MTDENGLVYMRARYYSPTLKRFINADVVAGSITNAITLNRYAYANGNPVSNVDPFGLWPEWAEKVVKVASFVALATAAITVGAMIIAGTGGTALAVAGVALGTAAGGVVGGMYNESNEESYINGWVGGAVSGLIQSSATAIFSYPGTIIGGSIGSGVGTFITESLNNNDKPIQDQKPTSDIVKNSLVASAVSLVTNTITATISAGVDMALDDAVNHSNLWINSTGQPVMSPLFGEGIKQFFGVIDDINSYSASEKLTTRK